MPTPNNKVCTATFPQYVQFERQHGSIAAGIKPTAPATPAKSLFFTFPQGTQYLVDTLVAQLHHVTMHTNHPIQQITQNEGHYQLLGEHHAPIDADIVVLSTPAHHTAKLIPTIAPALAAHLQTQTYVSTGTISLAYHRDALPAPLDGYGVLYADGQKRYFNAITISSQKFTQRAPTSHILIRMFFGGQSDQELLAMDDQQISTLATAELQKILNITTPPEFTRIFRWPFGTPQYTLDHHQWLTQCMTQTPPQLFLTGSSYGGIGIPDCIHHAQQTAQQIIHSCREG
jgi:oxygen-dependent protoporphyrinogen oxidase